MGNPLMGPTFRVLPRGPLDSYRGFANALAIWGLGAESSQALALFEATLTARGEARKLQVLLEGYRYADDTTVRKRCYWQIVSWIRSHGPQIEQVLAAMRRQYVRHVSMFDDSIPLSKRVMTILAPSSAMLGSVIPAEAGIHFAGIDKQDRHRGAAAKGGRGGGKGPLVIPEDLDLDSKLEISGRIGEITAEQLEIMAARARAEITRGGREQKGWLALLRIVKESGPLPLRARATELFDEVSEEFRERIDVEMAVASQIGQSELYAALEVAVLEGNEGEITELVGMLLSFEGEAFQRIANQLMAHSHPEVRHSFYYLLLGQPDLNWPVMWEFEKERSRINLTSGNQLDRIRLHNIWGIFAKAGVESAVQCLYDDARFGDTVIQTSAYGSLSRVLLDKKTTPSPLLESITDKIFAWVVQNIDGTVMPAMMIDVLGCAERLLARAQQGSKTARQVLQTLDTTLLENFIHKQREVSRVRALLGKIEKYKSKRD